MKNEIVFHLMIEKKEKNSKTDFETDSKRFGGGVVRTEREKEKLLKQRE